MGNPVRYLATIKSCASLILSFSCVRVVIYSLPLQYFNISCGCLVFFKIIGSSFKAYKTLNNFKSPKGRKQCFGTGRNSEKKTVGLYADHLIAADISTAILRSTLLERSIIQA